MRKQRLRVCLEQGPSLDINMLARTGMIVFGDITLARKISWGRAPGYIWTADISANLLSPQGGWIQVDLQGTCQRIRVISEGRHFGGLQHYFLCPVTKRRASVLWRPPGTDEFRSRLGWGKSVAYITQIGSWIDRAHRGKEKIKNILLGGEDPDDWDLPPRPKWMRVKTYDKYVEKFDHYEAALAAGPDGKSLMSRQIKNGERID